MKILVVGGGIIGCATAYELAKAGRSVLILERGAYVDATEVQENADGFVWNGVAVNREFGKMARA